MSGRNRTGLKREIASARVGRIVACALAASLAGSAGCDEDEALRTFRDAASPVFFDGLSTLVGGLIDGLDAVVQEGVDTANDGADTTGTDTSGGDTTGG